MKYLKANIPNTKELKVLHLCDLHWGSEAQDKQFMERIRSFIDVHQPRILINGDLIQGTIKTSKGDLYEQRMTPEEQVDAAVEFFKPFAHLIDGVVSGNHDQRIEQEVSIDVVKMFCRYLDIEDKYLGYGGVVGYSLNKCHYSIELFHGAHGAGTVGALDSKMKKFRKTDSDIFMCGHFHQKLVTESFSYKIDPFNKRLHKVKRYNICGGCCVGYEKYAERMRMEERETTQCVLTLKGEIKKKKIEVEWLV
jgi:hypothetical protein